MQVATKGAVPPAAARVIVAQIYQQTLLAMIEDLEKRKPEAIEWFTFDLENVGLVAEAAGFKPKSVYEAISFPLLEAIFEEIGIRYVAAPYGLQFQSVMFQSALRDVLKRIAGVRRMLAETS